MSTIISLTNHLVHLEDIHRTLDEKITKHLSSPLEADVLLVSPSSICLVAYI